MHRPLSLPSFSSSVKSLATRDRTRRLARRILRFEVDFPAFMLPAFRAVYCAHHAVQNGLRIAWCGIYRKPVLRSLCASAGTGLRLEFIPAVRHVHLTIGDDVNLSGSIGFVGGRVFPDVPRISVGDRVFIGHRTTFHAQREIIVEDDVLIAGGCYITDNPSHPINTERRIAGEPPPPESVRPVRICRGAWIGRNAMILPGVRIGEGAIVAGGAVVSKDVPDYSIYVGAAGRLLSYGTT